MKPCRRSGLVLWLVACLWCSAALPARAADYKLTTLEWAPYTGANLQGKGFISVAIVDAMKPNFDEVSDAANILLAAQAADWGPIQYAGELHDRATYRYFWEILQKARLTNVAISEEANAAFFSVSA